MTAEMTVSGVYLTAQVPHDLGFQKRICLAVLQLLSQAILTEQAFAIDTILGKFVTEQKHCARFVPASGHSSSLFSVR